MSGIGVLVGVPIVCLVIVVVVVVVVLLYLRWRRQKQTADSYRDEGKSRRSNHGSSTMRSDESDHPYENPSLPRKAIMNKHRNNNDRSHQDQGNSSNSALPADPYASLEGQSLPHHYEGLGEKKSSRGNSRNGATTIPTGGAAVFGDDSLYDELMTSTDQGTTGGGSDYYFRLEPGSRGGTTKSDSSRLNRSLRSNPDNPYDKVVIGDDKNRTGRPEDSAKSGTLESSSSSVNPYYFKVERNPSKNGPSSPQGLLESGNGPKDDTDAGDIRDGSQISTEIRHPIDDSLHASSDLQVVSQPDMPDGTVTEEGGVSLQHASSYDKLDREMLRQPPADDHVNTNYSKLVPRLASEATNSKEAQSPTSIPGYQSVQISNDFEISTDSIDGEETEYNKLERGRERDIRVLLGPADEETSTPPAPHKHDSPDENVPVEL